VGYPNVVGKLPISVRPLDSTSPGILESAPGTTNNYVNAAVHNSGTIQLGANNSTMQLNGTVSQDIGTIIGPSTGLPGSLTLTDPVGFAATGGSILDITINDAAGLYLGNVTFSNATVIGNVTVTGTVAFYGGSVNGNFTLASGALVFSGASFTSLRVSGDFLQNQSAVLDMRVGTWTKPTMASRLAGTRPGVAGL
jgi:hypothetical protein